MKHVDVWQRTVVMLASYAALSAGCRIDTSSSEPLQQPPDAATPLVSPPTAASTPRAPEPSSSPMGARSMRASRPAPTQNSPMVDAGGGDAAARKPDEQAWSAGDYPDDVMSDNFLKLPDVKGQRGLVRQYKVHVPASYRPNQALPVVFCMHGLYQDSAMFCVTGSGLLERSDRDSFILVMPVGYSGSWNAGRCCGDARDMKLDDVAFVRGIFEELQKHLQIDRERVFAVGFANGGFMTYRLACEAADIFSAVAIGSGGLGINAFQDVSASNPDLLSAESDFADCRPSRPVSILHIHGSLDELVPASLQPKSLAHHAAAAGCASSTTVIAATSKDDTTCASYDACPQGVELTGCTIQDGGHCWFGQDDCGTGAGELGALFTGSNSSFMRNTDAALTFLRAHGL